MTDKKDKKGEASAQSQTYTESQIAQMTDAEVAEIATLNGIESGVRHEQVEALRLGGVILPG